MTASDLGHYIADGHNPLHLTRNYNGQYTGQMGIHYRYESNMINRFQSQINYSGDSIGYIENINEHLFSFIYDNYVYVDSVLYADSAAKVVAGNTTSDIYYQKMWEISKGFTVKLFENVSRILAALIYTAWKNAGSPQITTEVENEITKYFDFKLEQNYPNPFNPSTTINYVINKSSFVNLVVYDLLGNEIVTLADEIKNPGVYEIHFDGNNLTSGVYLYVLKAENFTESKKFILLK